MTEADDKKNKQLVSELTIRILDLLYHNDTANAILAAEYALASFICLVSKNQAAVESLLQLSVSNIKNYVTKYCESFLMARDVKE